MEEDKRNYKQKFIDYCKDKIKFLDSTTYKDPISEEEITVKVIMVDNVRDIKDGLIVKDYEDEITNLMVVKDGELKIDTPMYDPIQLAAELTFSSIDDQFYKDILDNWYDLYIEDMMEENK